MALAVADTVSLLLLASLLLSPVASANPGYSSTLSPRLWSGGRVAVTAAAAAAAAAEVEGEVEVVCATV